MTEEIWKDIEGYEQFYQISNQQRVKSLDRTVICKDGQIKPIKGRILKQRVDNRGKGYYIVTLCRRAIKVDFSIHRLVALAFIPNPDNLPEVNHIDGDTRNNDISNLEWCTHQQNCLHAYKANLRQPPRAALGKFGSQNPLSKTVGQYTTDGKLVALYGGACEAARILGWSQGMISNACRGEVATYKSYIWKYESKAAPKRNQTRTNYV
jgi:hypothetical protein